MGVLRSAVLVLVLGLSAPAWAVEIKGAGATFPAPLYYNWIQKYKVDRPDVTIRYDAVGSGQGIKRFQAGNVHFGASDAAMTDAQIAAVKEGVVLVPVTAGIVVIAYNVPGLNLDLRLSRETLLGIFGGEITKWNDPRIAADNPGALMPNRTISVVTRRDGSGTTFAFTNHLSAISEAWRDTGPGTGTLIDWPGAAMTAYGNDGVAGRIRVSEYSIGYVEFGFAQRLGLPMAHLQNRAGDFIRPSPEAGAAALSAAATDMPDNGRQFIPDPVGPESYPIVTYSWLLLRQTDNKAEIRNALRDFIEWGVSQGQELAVETGYIPLPPNVVERTRMLLARVK